MNEKKQFDVKKENEQKNETTEETKENLKNQDDNIKNQEDDKSQEKQTDSQKDNTYFDQLVRLQADFENFKKRTRKEKDDIYKYSLEGFVTKLLPVIDNLERATSSLEQANEENNTYLQGIQMVFQQLMDVLKSEGLKEIEALDSSFDPNYHHGVATETKEGIEDNIIIDVFQKGYLFKEKVIRPAMVKICKQ